MKEFLRKMNTGREGATLITVVIATAFLIAVGVIVLSASTKYLVSVYMDRNSNENLYDAEGVLAEVRSGLLEYAGESGAAAYRMVVEDYGNTNTFASGGVWGSGTLSAKERFARAYICGIIQELEGGTLNAGITKRWDDADIQSVNNVVTDGSVVTDRVKSFSIDNIKCLTHFPDSVKTKAMVETTIGGGGGVTTPSYAVVLNGETKDLCYGIYRSSRLGYYLMIKNVVIDHTDDAGYRSTINTDIQITVPDYKFDGNDSLDMAKDFLSISDGQLEVGGSANRSVDDTVTNDGVTFDGNIYAGGDIDSTEDLNNAGIVINEDMAAHFNCGLMISRGSLEAFSHSKVEVNGAKQPFVTGGVVSYVTSDEGDIYLKNIRLSNRTGFVSPGSGTLFSIKANAYIENDLDIRDSGTRVTLGGRYYGYSYNENNDPASLGSQSDYSSAILVNGTDTTINTDNLKQLLLSGRSYVSRVTDIGMNNDIMMGESLSVKSNQLAYLVPDKYISVGNNPHNPITGSEAGSNYLHPNSLVDVDALKEDFVKKNDDGTIVKDSNGNPVSLLDETNPVTGNYRPAENGGESYVYLFLNFKDGDCANRYFRSFYKGEYITQIHPGEEDDDRPGEMTVDDMKRRAMAYISDRDVAGGTGGIYLDPALFLIAGNIVHNYYADGGPSFQSASYFDGNGLPLPALLNDGKQVGVKYCNLQKYLTPSGDSTGMRLLNSGKYFVDGSAEQTVDRLVDNHLVNLSDTTIPEIPLSEGIVEPGTGARVFSDKSTGAITIDASYHGSAPITAPDGGLSFGRCLVVHNGPVNIAADTSGLIIANGDVTVGAKFQGLIITTGKVIVNSSVTLQADPVLVDKLLTYAQSDPRLAPIFGITTPDTHNPTVAEECMRYVNWQKNAY